MCRKIKSRSRCRHCAPYPYALPHFSRPEAAFHPTNDPAYAETKLRTETCGDYRALGWCSVSASSLENPDNIVDASGEGCEFCATYLRHCLKKEAERRRRRRMETEVVRTTMMVGEGEDWKPKEEWEKARKITSKLKGDITPMESVFMEMVGLRVGGDLVRSKGLDELSPPETSGGIRNGEGAGVEKGLQLQPAAEERVRTWWEKLEVAEQGGEAGDWKGDEEQEDGHGTDTGTFLFSQSSQSRWRGGTPDTR
ncbi:hypothetical protein MKZ38_008750 [Zalerion maritima]|uniref:Uncharacterized protein n=1 Tax=Zalerion maritima TaxID=339359 RepID=A0AAD5RH44_9PEZI|nr:hypothetical protein MKZ38_008750 [Zalerion maritima]